MTSFDCTERALSQSDCAICLESIENIYAVKCGHVFCSKCFSDWKNEKILENRPITCPLCRINLYEENEQESKPESILELNFFIENEGELQVEVYNLGGNIYYESEDEEEDEEDEEEENIEDGDDDEEEREDSDEEVDDEYEYEDY
jgi:hypothetical protein